MYKILFIFLPFISLSQNVETMSYKGETVYILDSVAAVNIIKKAEKGEKLNKINLEVDKLITEIANHKIVSDKMQMLMQEQLVRLRSDLISETAEKKKLIRNNQNFEQDKERLKSQRNAFAAIAVTLLTIIITK